MAIDNIPIIVSDNAEEIEINVEDTGHPYYVGARAYVTQTAEGAIVTVIDKEGTTTAILLDGNQGRITDILYDPETQTIQKINGVVASDLVTLSDITYDSDTKTIKKICGGEESDLVTLSDVAISNDYDDLDNTPPLADVATSGVYGDLLNKPVITPEMFGAVGDGTEDDTTALQEALNIGGLIVCKAGSNYKITSTLRIKKDTTILLFGATITTTATHLFFNFLDDDEFTGYDGNGNIAMLGGTIVGGSASFIHGKNIYIDRVQFSNSTNDHFFEICACKNFNITNCSFVGMSTTAPSRKEYINIDNCTYSNFPHFSADSATYDLTIVDGVLIENCYFDISNGVMQDAIGKHSYADSGNVSAYKAKNITISNCRIVGATQIAVLLLGVENVLMESCRLENCTAIANCRNSVNVSIRDNIATGITTYCEIEALTKFAFVNNFVETSSTSSVVNIAGSNDTLEFRDNSIKSSSNPALIRFDSANAITVTHFTVFNNALDVVGKRRVIYSISGTVSCQVSTSDYIEYWLGNDSVATNSHFNLTDFNALFIQLGAIGSTTSIAVTIRSFTERNFLVGESFPYVYVSTGGVVSYGTITITDANTVTATGLKIRDVIAQALPRR